MSRTFKTQPYWVIVNRVGDHIDHDHLHLGETKYTNKYIKDGKGNLVYEDHPVYYSAYEVVHGQARPGSDIKGEINKFGYSPEPYYGSWMYFKYVSSLNRDVIRNPRAYEEARFYVGSSDPDHAVLVWTEKRIKVERVVDYTVADHCTGWAPYTPGHWGVWNEVPCTIDADNYLVRQSAPSGASRARKAARQQRFGHHRTLSRDTLQEVTKAYNSGYEVDDYDEKVDITSDYDDKWFWD